jgi:hypothetical protein
MVFIVGLQDVLTFPIVCYSEQNTLFQKLNLFRLYRYTCFIDWFKINLEPSHIH